MKDLIFEASNLFIVFFFFEIISYKQPNIYESIQKGGEEV